MKKVLAFLLVFALGFTLASCTNEEDVLNAQDAAQKLSLDADLTAVTSDLVLPTTGLHEATVTWESDNAAIAADGTVTRPDVDAGDVTVILTATVTVGSASETKEFRVKVLDQDPSAAVTVKVLESSAVAKGDIVEVTGIVVGIISPYGYQLADDTGVVYVYLGSTPEVSIGDNVTVLGEKEVYYGMTEVVNLQSTVVNSTGNALPAFVATDLGALGAQNPETTDWYNDMLATSGLVMVDEDDVNLVWFTQDLEMVKVQLYTSSSSTDDAAKAKVAEVEALDGKKVDLDLIVKDYYSSSDTWRVVMNGHHNVTESIMFRLAEKAKLAAAYTSMYFNSLPSEIVVDLDLPMESPLFPDTTPDDESDDVVLSWSSSNEDVIDNEGKVTLPVGQNEEVTLTLSVQIQDVTITKDYVLNVKDANTVTPIGIADALALEDGASLIVEGIVTAVFNENDYPGVHLIDAAGNVLYAEGAIDAEIGDKIVVQGNLDTFTSFSNSRRQLSNAVKISEVDTGNVFTAATDVDAAGLVALYEAATSKVYTMTLVLEGTSYGNFDFVGVVDGTDIVMKDDYFPTLETYLDGNGAIEITFVVQGIDYSDVKIIPIAFPGLDAADVSAIVEAIVAVPESTTNDLDLVTEIPLFDAVVTWTSTNTAIDPATGVVTRPANGEGDATGNLVASVVIGDAAPVELTFAITVPEEPAEPDTVATTLALANDAPVYVTGIISFIDGDNTFWIEDADGTTIFVDDYNEAIDMGALDIEVGDEVIVAGLRGTYKVELIDGVTEVTVVSDGNTVYNVATIAVNVTDVDAFRTATTIDDFGKWYTFTDVVVVKKTSSYIYIKTEDGLSSGAGQIAIRIDESDTLPAIEEGDTVTFTAFMYGASQNPFDRNDSIWRLAVLDATTVTVTPAS
jgi:uncharacterized protein YdeI (BOF family)